MSEQGAALMRLKRDYWHGETLLYQTDEVTECWELWVKLEAESYGPPVSRRDGPDGTALIRFRDGDRSLVVEVLPAHPSWRVGSKPWDWTKEGP